LYDFRAGLNNPTCIKIQENCIDPSKLPSENQIIQGKYRAIPKIKKTEIIQENYKDPSKNFRKFEQYKKTICNNQEN
jgi:hypothetical protein